MRTNRAYVGLMAALAFGCGSSEAAGSGDGGQQQVIDPVQVCDDAAEVPGPKQCEPDKGRLSIDGRAAVDLEYVHSYAKREGVYDIDVSGGHILLQTVSKDSKDEGCEALTRAVVFAAPSDESSGPIYCAGEGSGSSFTRELDAERDPKTGEITRIDGDIFHLDLKQVANIGPCPGEPVEGHLVLCAGGVGGGGCGVEESNLDGVDVENAGGEFQGGAYNYKFSNDAFDVRIRTTSGDAFKDSVKWAVIMTRPDGPWGGRVFCAGESSEKRREDIYSPTYLDFKNLSVLPDCENGKGTVSGCLH